MLCLFGCSLRRMEHQSRMRKVTAKTTPLSFLIDEDASVILFQRGIGKILSQFSLQFST